MIKKRTMANHGYEPQSKLWKYFVLYPPLRGIVQLTNSDALRFRNWSFTNKKGFTLLEVIVIIVMAAIAATFLVNFMGPNLIGSVSSSAVSAVRVSNHYALIGVVEKMNIDYNNLMNAGDANVLGTLQSHIQNGNVGTSNPYFGQYNQVTKFITFDPTTHIEQAAETPGSNTLKVTISLSDQTITTLFTK